MGRIKDKKPDYAAMFTLRKDGRYQAVIPSDTPWDRPKYLYDRDPEALYRKVQAAKEPKIPMFAEVAEEWRTDHWEKIESGTKKCYNSHVDDIVSKYKKTPLTEVGAAEINRDILRLKEKGLSAKSVKTRRGVYKMIFDYAILRGFASINPALSVTVPRGLPHKTREAPEDDVIKIIRDNSDSAPFGLFPMLLIYTGFRKGEALALQWQDVDRKAKTISCTKSVEYPVNAPNIKTPKTEAGYRKVPLLDDLAKVLVKPKGTKSSDYIFGGATPMKSSDYNQAWLNWCRAVGLIKQRTEGRGLDKDGKPRTCTIDAPAITAHQLRHGYATILYEAGIDELAAKELLGHADISTTRAIYTHLRQKQRGKAAQTLNEYFSGAVSDNVSKDSK